MFQCIWHHCSHPAGRDEDAKALVGLLQTQLSSGHQLSARGAAVCVVAGPGTGKSCLSVDVAWRMAKAGACPGVWGGVCMLELRVCLTSNYIALH